MSFSTLQQSHRDAIAAPLAVLHHPQDYDVPSNEEMMVMARFGAEQSRLADAHNTLIAAQLARRSAPELGSTGLAQRTGHRTRTGAGDQGGKFPGCGHRRSCRDTDR
jgi:hypothetical protein